MFAVLADMIVSDEIEKINQTFYEEAPDWGFVLNWNKSFKGQPGLPNEPLYICYTDQTTKFSSGILPTSIVFKNKEDAIRVLKFEPAIADFDIKSKMGKVDGTEYFKPYKQVTIKWQAKIQIGLPTPGF